MKTKLMAYCVAMDENGSLWVATWTRQRPELVNWERMPLAGAGMLCHEPINALVVGRVLKPEWAVDAYVWTQSQAESLASIS